MPSTLYPVHPIYIGKFGQITKKEHFPQLKAGEPPPPKGRVLHLRKSAHYAKKV